MAGEGRNRRNPPLQGRAMNLSIEAAVRERFGAAARHADPDLGGPVRYDPSFLGAIPEEVLDRDYGRGDPTRLLRPGEVVLDLGSGSGKGSFVAAQVVGPEGRVIGVDGNREMLALARRHQEEFARRVGYGNVEFRCGLIQDLRLDLDELGALLAASPVRSAWDYLELRDLEDRLRRVDPLVPDASIDCVVANGSLNLVRPGDRPRALAELLRVLRPGGRAVLCDLAADADVPPAMQADPALWAVGLAGALREDALLDAFEAAGFRGVRLAERAAEPWKSAGGVAFRAVTVVAETP